MNIHKKIEDYLVAIFKIGMGLRILCLFGKVLLSRYDLTETSLAVFVDGLSTVMLAITTGILTYEIIKVFNKSHKKLVQEHRHIVVIIEFIVMRILFVVLFFNQKIPGAFILHLNEVSEQNQRGSLILLCIIVAILVGKYVQQLMRIQTITLDDSGVFSMLFAQVKKLYFYICIVAMTLLLAAYAPFNFLKPRIIYTFIQETIHNSIDTMRQYSNSPLFLYVQLFFMVSLVIWTMFDAYFVYTYRNVHKQNKR